MMMMMTTTTMMGKEKERKEKTARLRLEDFFFFFFFFFVALPQSPSPAQPTSPHNHSSFFFDHFARSLTADIIFGGETKWEKTSIPKENSVLISFKALLFARLSPYWLEGTFRLFSASLLLRVWAFLLLGFNTGPFFFFFFISNVSRGEKAGEG
jgi:hypothetical protein